MKFLKKAFVTKFICIANLSLADIVYARVSYEDIYGTDEGVGDSAATNVFGLLTLFGLLIFLAPIFFKDIAFRGGVIWYISFLIGVYFFGKYVMH